jgi:hypothetical protein
VEDVAEKCLLTEKQALILLAETRLSASSARDAALNAVGKAADYFKTAPEPVSDVSPRDYNATVQGTVTHLYDPYNADEHQVALMECSRTGEQFKFIIHEKTRTSKAWTEWGSDEMVKDLREGDEVKLIDAKPHYPNSGKVDIKFHADSWTHIALVERGDGEYISRHCVALLIQTEYKPHSRQSVTRPNLNTHSQDYTVAATC